MTDRARLITMLTHCQTNGLNQTNPLDTILPLRSIGCRGEGRGTAI